MNVLAVDDGGFYSGTGQKYTLLIAVIMDDSFKIRDLQVNMLEIDGLNATEKIKQLIRRSRFKLTALLLPSTCLAGFNIVGLKNVGEILPVIIANPRGADTSAVEEAIRKHFQDSEERLLMLQQAGHPKKYKFPGGSCIIYHAGISSKKVAKILNAFTRTGAAPEPLRVVRIIAKGLTLRRNAGKV